MAKRNLQRNKALYNWSTILRHTLLVFLLTMTYQLHGQRPIGLDAADWVIFDRTGKVVKRFPSILIIHPMTETVFAVQEENAILFLDEELNEVFRSSEFSLKKWGFESNNRIPVYDNKSYQYGFLDRKGRIAIPVQFDYVQDFVYRYTVVGMIIGSPDPVDFDGPRRLIYNYGLIDINGNIVLPIEYSSISLGGMEFNRVLAKKDDKRYLIDVSDKPRVHKEIVGYYINTTKSGRYGFLIKKVDGRGFGVMNWNGEITISPRFTSVWSVSSLGWLVSEYGWTGVVDHNGDRLDIPEEFETSMHFEFMTLGDHYLYYLENGKRGMMDTSYNRIIPPIYDYIKHRGKDEIFIVEIDNKEGYIKKNGEWLTELKYRYCSYFYNGYAVAQVVDEEP